MDYLLGRHFISLFMILLFSIRLSSQRTVRDKELRYFWITVISCLVLVLEDQLESMASMDSSLRFWRILLSIAGYTFRSVATAGLVFVVCKPEQRKFFWWIPCLVNFLISCTAFFTDIAFGFDEEYVFYRGPLGYVSFIVPIFYMLVILFFSFRYFVDRRRRTDQLILLTCVLLCLSSSLLDALHGGVRLHEAIMLSCIFFYVFLRSYDVRRDALTTVLNRQSLYEDCRTLNKKICAAASVDMNGLKILNDRQGHQAGDSALRKIGQYLREASEKEGLRAYRIGGDEFVLLFFHTDKEKIEKTLDKIQNEVKTAGYSIATGYVIREENDDPERMIQRSDIKMFEQKAQYYRDQKHDRRQRRSPRQDQYPELTRKALEDSPQPLAVYRFSDHRIETLVISDGFCKLFGYANRDQALHVLDHEMYKYVHTDDHERLSGAMLRFLEGSEELDVIYRTREGMETDFRVVHARGTHIHTNNGDRVAHVWYMDEGIYAEGDEESGSLMNQALNRALHEESLLSASYYDELTGLPNLTWFFNLCEARKSEIFREGKQGVLLYMDLNGLKYFNHDYGFSEGDQLLKAFATLLVRFFEKDHCCRISADRFAAHATTEGLEEKLQHFFTEAALIHNGNSLPVRVGIYTEGTETVSASTAFDRAKLACEHLRLSETSSFQYFKDEMLEALRKRLYIVTNIDRAIREKWIKIYYQPIVRASDGVVCDAEALARWVDPVKGFLSPADFIQHLENAGLIYKLDLYVLDQVIEKLKSQQSAGIDVVPHSINLSRSDFEVCDIVEEICKRVDAAGIPHNLINIEITESLIGRDFDFMTEQVDRFHREGFSVWMDDFGSGYSSLDVLQSIQFDLIKFDMSFLRKLDEGESCRIILTNLMNMASMLKKDTVCEGIEKEEHASFLRSIGCSKLQGYLFGKPALYEPELSASVENKPDSESTDASGSAK